MFKNSITIISFFTRFLKVVPSFSNVTGIPYLLYALIIIGTSNQVYSKDRSNSVRKWVGTWGTAPQLVEPNNMPPQPGLSNNTLRQVVRVSIGGKKLQLKFSNEYGKKQLKIKSVHIAASKGAHNIDASTARLLEFNKNSVVTIEPGAIVVCDPLLFNLKPLTDVAITISFGETPPELTGHPGSRTTSYLLPGNHNSANAEFANSIKTDHWYVVSGIDVEASKSSGAVVTFGDSITDGRGSGTNKQNRWADILARSLQSNSKTRKVGVLNMGIGGNAVLRGGLGPTGLRRFERDVLNQNGVRWVIILEGVNDLGSTRDSAAAFRVKEGLISAYEQMINQAHAKGIKVYGATITPFKKAGYYTPFRDAARNAVNDWIRTSGRFDAVIDFDKVLRDPQNAATMLSEAQSDYLHPNELGYELMGKSVNLSLFK